MVEKILDDRQRRHQTQYLVKWQGYPDDEATWQPEGNLLDEADQNASLSTPSFPSAWCSAAAASGPGSSSCWTAALALFGEGMDETGKLLLSAVFLTESGLLVGQLPIRDNSLGASSVAMLELSCGTSSQTQHASKESAPLSNR
ncbi:heterochromatin protein 1-like [Sycon ciliatum]|uniref:heterochromatin protein 1-like n=1 Tax=Sycon ciliatum TaxID=27933 RepID=UPI0031F6BA78